MFAWVNWTSALAAGVVAGVVSTLVQIALWATLTDAFPAILWRDGRLAAAIVLGPRVLDPSANFDARVMLVATLVHGVLSIVYAVMLGTLAGRLGLARSLVAGALFGVGLYAVNLYGFTALFPWFAIARGGITLAAHVAFGLSAGATYCLLRRR